MKKVKISIENFHDKKMIVAYEGGAIFTAELDNKYYVISDENTFRDLLDEEDAKDLEFESVYEFDDLKERDDYIKKTYGNRVRNRDL